MYASIRFILCCCFWAGGISLLQAQDSTKKKMSVGSLAKDVYRSFWVKGEKRQDSTFFQRSEESYQRFAGKVIRHIIIRNLSFGESVNDTSSSIISTLTRTADKLQTNTKDYIIR